jgi:hypothetical protein
MRDEKRVFKFVENSERKDQMEGPVSLSIMIFVHTDPLQSLLHIRT